MTASPLETQLRADTAALAMPKGRRVGKPGHDKAREFLIGRLTEIGLAPFLNSNFEIPYSGQLHRTREDHTFSNLVGVIPGRDRSLPPLLLGAHYDSVIDAPCADDNATSVALNLAIAERVMAKPLERDLIIALYDAEEPPYFLTDSMGSTRFYEDQVDDRGVHFALISDLVGHDVTIPEGHAGGIVSKLAAPLAPLTFATGAESHPDLPGLLEEIDVPKGMKLIATLNEYVGDMSDHAVFRWNEIPYLFLSCGHWEHYHQPSDTPDRLNYNKMAAITRYAESVIRSTAVADLPEFVEAEDPVEFESATWKRSLGILRKPVAKALGVSDFKTRSDINAAASALQSLGL